MSDIAYHFAVGKFQCIVFSDGALGGPENMGMNCIYIDTGKNKILVDTGCGNLFGPNTGHLVENMKTDGIKPEDIDTIIFDHMHFDHTGGSCDSQGKPVFPRARYITTEKEWKYVEAGPTDDEGQNHCYAPARKDLLPLKDRFDLVGDNAVILPGFKFIPAHGHTVGNSMIEITSGGTILLSLGDIIHMKKEFTEPECCNAFDCMPGQAVKTRVKILPELAKAGTLVFATHFTFPGLGYFRQNNGALSWEPIKQ
jgi:glyoxylase-like metal-dependent hydrolase (beta-lactamase superfamily II)